MDKILCILKRIKELSEIIADERLYGDESEDGVPLFAKEILSSCGVSFIEARFIVEKIQTLGLIESHRWINGDEDTVCLIKPYRDFQRRYEQYLGNISAENPVRVGNRPSYDPIANEIILGETRLSIPPSSNQAVLCKALFSLPLGSWLNENDVIADFYRGKRKQRSFYDAIRALNEKTKEAFGLERMLEYLGSKVRIRPQIFE
jgi:hypothetical protein